MKNSALLGFVLIIIVVGCVVYANSLNGKFIWDDNFLVKDNTYIKDGSHIKSIFTKNIGAGAGRSFKPYRPIQMCTYLIDYFLWGLYARGYHITNTILHIFVALAIYFLLNILYKERLLSLLTSLFFVVHPIHTEAVSYISGRADSLSALFMILCFISYLKYIETKKMNVFILMLTTYIVAVFSRETSLTLPVLLLLYHYSFKNKPEIKAFFSIISIAIFFILLRNFALSSLEFPGFTPSTLMQRIPGFFVALTSYVRLLFLPFDLHMGYGYQFFSFLDLKALMGIIIFCSLSVYLFKRRNKKGVIYFGISWFFIMLLPQSNLYPVGAYMAEHWLYLPSVGFFLVFASLLSNICKSKKGKIFGIISIVSLLTFYSCLTVKQNNYWKEPIIFYETTLKYVSDNPKLYNNLGNLYRDEGNPEKAISLFKKAIKLKTDNATAHNNLGNAYIDIGKIEQAIASYNKAIGIDPNHTMSYYNLGIAYNKIGRKEKAILAYKKVVKLNPNDRDVHNDLGKIYGSIGENKKAISSFKKSIEIDPEFGLGYNNLAVTYFSEKQYNLAIKYCDKAVDLGYKVHSNFLKLLEEYR